MTTSLTAPAAPSAPAWHKEPDETSSELTDRVLRGPLEDLPMAAEGHRVMHLLERGVPLTLLIDLLTPYGTDSAEIMATEARERRRTGS